MIGVVTAASPLQPLANRQAVNPRQHDVQYNGVVCISYAKVHGGKAIACIVNNIVRGL